MICRRWIWVLVVQAFWSESGLWKFLGVRGAASGKTAAGTLEKKAGME